MIRFTTVAANADVLGEDTPLAGDPAGAAVKPRSGSAGRTGADRPEHRRGAEARGEPGAGRPGRDINAAGFIKDEDTTKPS